MAGELDGKVVIVTGASRGIGQGIAIACAAAGARVVVAGRTTGSGGEGTIDETAAQITAAGGEAVAVRCDVGEPADVAALVAATLDRWGRIDALVNNAGLMTDAGLLDTPADQWRALMRANLDGTYHGTMAVLPTMQAQRAGAIINLSSGRVDTDDGLWTAYATSKAAIDRLTIKLAAEVRPFGIAVNALRPGGVLTPGVVKANRGDISAFVPVDHPSKKILPACVFLAGAAATPARFFTGQIVREADFGVSWP